MTGSIFAEDFQETPYWWQAAPPEEAESEPLPETVDVAIVGAGYAGLCCALELSENGVKVAVLEAGPLGHGASTRNGGMVTGGQKFVVSGAIKGVDADRTARILEDAQESLDLLEARVERYGLDADYQRCGRVILASVPKHYRRLETWCDLLAQRTKAKTSLVPRPRLTEEIGGSRYHGGLLIEDYGGLHPAKYHRALRRTVAAAGASLHSHAAVQGIRRGEGGFLLKTARGVVQAREVMVATNGYTGELVDYLRARVVPVASYIIATETLPEGLADRLSPRRRMFSDSKRDLCYFRLSPDGTRVLYGARPGVLDRELRPAAVSLHRQLCEIWPEMADLKLSFCWTGNVAMSSDHVPHMGRVDGLHYAVGCNGSGVAMMSYLGYQSARKILGIQNRPCAFDSDSFPRPPLYRGHPWFLPLVAGWYRLRDSLDRVFP